MEINILLRIQTLDELEQFVVMMRSFPALGRALHFEKANAELQKTYEELSAEVADLKRAKENMLIEVVQKEQLQPSGAP
jgi:hypothetical protein